MVGLVGLTGRDLSGLLELRHLLSRVAAPREVDTRDWPDLLMVEVGKGLVPRDAVASWDEWVLFRQLVPRTRERLEQGLGFPVMGVKVRVSESLAPLEYQAFVNGRPGHPGLVSGADDVTQRDVADLADGAPWEPGLVALEAQAFSRPAEVFVPYTLQQLVEAWRADPQVPVELLDTLDSDRFVRAVVWQRLRRLVEDNGWLPAWSEGAGDAVAASVAAAHQLLARPGRVNFEDNLGLDR